VLPPLALVIKPSGEVHANRFGARGASSLLIEPTDDGLASLRRRATRARNATNRSSWRAALPSCPAAAHRLPNRRYARAACHRSVRMRPVAGP
jgi:hypothetical protein